MTLHSTTSSPATLASNDTSQSLYWLYSLPQFCIAYSTLAIVNFVPAFYARDIAIPMLAISTLMFLSRGLDVFTDPLIGALSDRVQTRWGRRKPWLVAGLPVLLAGVWMLFNPPDDAGKLYFFGSISVYFLGMTMIQLPYFAWGAELPTSYDSRTRITAKRELVAAIGSISALLTAIYFTHSSSDSLRPMLSTMAGFITVVLPLLVLACFITVPPSSADYTPIKPIPFFDGIRLCASNPHFRYFTLCVAILFLAIAPAGATGWFFFEHILLRSDLYAFTTLMEFFASLLGIPLWSWLAQRRTKHQAAALALLWMAVWTGLISLASQYGEWPAIICAVIRSSALGALLMLPMSMVADVIDIEARNSGVRRTGMYMAFGGIVLKLALSAGVGIALALPGLAGFDAASATNSEAAKFSVVVSFSLLPAALYLIAVPLFWCFPVSREDTLPAAF